MKLAISNLASNNTSDIACNVSLIECVFSKIGDIMKLDANQVIAWKNSLPANLTPYSVQSITYGCSLQDFSYLPQNTVVVDKILELARALNLQRLVFGSPGIRKGAPDANMFAYIDEQLTGSNMVFCIEPNARTYGGEYFFDVEEIAAFLDTHKFKNIATMIDTHNSWLEHRCTVDDIHMHRDVIQHVHSSETNLQGFTSIDAHAMIAQALNAAGYDHVVTLESHNLHGVEEFVKIYGEV